MSGHLLQYWCKPRIYVLPEDGRPYDGQVDGFRVYETVEPCDDSGAPEDAVSYRIVAEKEVSSRDEALSVGGVVFDLAADLDRLWIYVTGEPLFYLRTSLEIVDAPDHWESNYNEVHDALYREEPGPTLLGETKISQTSWRGFPYYPLEKALRLRPALENADDRLSHLVTLHHEALTTRGVHARLLMFAKAIELVDAMIDGARADKEDYLPKATGEDLRRRFKWLWKIANGRIDTRHVVARETGELHPELTTEDREDFLHDADLVIRDVVCTRLGTDTLRLGRR